MKIDVQRHGTVTVVVPQDAITETTAAELRSALEREGLQSTVRVVLDLSQVAYVDSAGIEFLLEFCGTPGLQRAPTAAGDRRPPIGATLRPRMAGLTDTVREALYLTDTLNRFTVFDTVPAAVRSYV
jgi:hypothetical protein